MNYSIKKVLFAWFLVFGWFGCTYLQAQPLDQAQIDTKLAAIAGYQQGTSRAPLIAVEDMIRQTQDQPEPRRIIRAKLSQMLDQEITPDCRAFICRQLWYLGAEDALPSLARMLQDEKTVDIACYALGNDPAPQINTILRETMPQVQGKTLVAIVNLLGNRRDSDSAQAIRQLVSHADKNIAEAALAALGKIGGDTARQMLVEMRAKGDPELAAAATHAYLRYAQGLADEGQAQPAAKIYEELAGPGEPGHIRGAALHGLAGIDEVRAVSLALAALQEPDPVLNRVAIGCIRKTGKAEVIQLVARELPKQETPLQVLLIGTLADMGNPAALPVITTSAQSKNEEVKIAALRALAAVGNASSVKLLTGSAVGGESQLEKDTAGYSLKTIRGDGVDEAIIRQMKDAKNENRPVLIQILAERSARGAVPALLEQAALADEKVSRSAFQALARLAGEQDLPAMVKIITSLSSEEARKDAEQAIIQTARQIADEQRQADVVLTALSQTKPVPVQCSLLRVLGGIANRQALERLQTAAEDKEPALQDTAVRALANWPNTQAAGALMKIIQNTPNETHRTLAFRGYIRLLSLPEERPVEETLNLYAQALAQARQTSEKQLVLSGLANVNHPQALQMVQSYLEDMEVQQEAALATLKIAQELKAANPKEVQAALEKLLANTNDQKLTQPAREILIEVIEPVAIFDGQTFTGWEGNQELFRIAEGAIVAGTLDKDTARNEFLCTEKEYADFELHLQVRLLGDPAHANAGIQFRSRRVPNNNEVSGYQADMGQQYWGCLYDEARRNTILAQADAAELEKVLHRDDWNDYVIRALGSRIQLWINGQMTIDYTEPDEKMEQTGIIGLQIHAGPPSQVWYRNINIKEIPKVK